MLLACYQLAVLMLFGLCFCFFVRFFLVCEMGRANEEAEWICKPDLQIWSGVSANVDGEEILPGFYGDACRMHLPPFWEKN